MNKLLRFGSFHDVTTGGMDGSMIRFPFSMVDSCKVGQPDERQATTSHLLLVGVAARTTWADIDGQLPRVLFSVGLKVVIERLRSESKIPAVLNAFVPHGDCPIGPDMLIDPEGATIEIDISL